MYISAAVTDADVTSGLETTWWILLEKEALTACVRWLLWSGGGCLTFTEQNDPTI